MLQLGRLTSACLVVSLVGLRAASWRDPRAAALRQTQPVMMTQRQYRQPAVWVTAGMMAAGTLRAGKQHFMPPVVMGCKMGVELGLPARAW